MKIDKQMVLGSLSGYSFIIIHHPLVTSVHEVDFDSLHTPFLESLKQPEIVFYSEPCQPKHNAYIFFFAITNEFMHIYRRIWCIGITGTHSPALVHNNIWYTIISSKINKIFVSIEIASCYKINIRSVGSSTVPPFPACQSGLNPGSIFQYVLFGQSIRHRILNELAIFCTNDKIAPREITLSTGLCYIVGFFQYFDTPITVFSKFKRYSGKYRNHTIAAITFQKNSRIIG